MGYREIVKEMQSTPIPTIDRLIDTLKLWQSGGPPTYCQLKQKPSGDTRVWIKRGIIGGGQIMAMYDDEVDLLILEQ